MSLVFRISDIDPVSDIIARALELDSSLVIEKGDRKLTIHFNKREIAEQFKQERDAQGKKTKWDREAKKPETVSLEQFGQVAKHLEFLAQELHDLKESMARQSLNNSNWSSSSRPSQETSFESWSSRNSRPGPRNLEAAGCLVYRPYTPQIVPMRQSSQATNEVVVDSISAPNCNWGMSSISNVGGESSGGSRPSTKQILQMLTKLNTPTQPAAASSSGVEEPAKRGRGRPRKNPVRDQLIEELKNKLSEDNDEEE